MPVSMLLSSFLMVFLLTSASPWVLVSTHTRQACSSESCQPVAGQRAPQMHVVQTCATPEACLTVREQLMQHVADAEASVHSLVQARSPAWYLRTTTSFVCQPETATTGEEER